VSFDFGYLLKASPGPRAQVAIGLAVIVAAASRLPLLPLHGWARSLLAEAPAGVAILSAGAFARLGGYLLVRLLAGGLHDGARLLAPFLALLGALTVAYAALAALRSSNLRGAAAYLAMVPGGVTAVGVAGLTPLSLDGAVLSLFAGGMAAALVVGACATVGERAQATSLAALGGLGLRMPRLAWLTAIGGLALLGIPSLASFPALVMVLFGSMQHQPVGAFGLAVGLVLTAIAVAWLLHRLFFGAPLPDAPPALDSSLSESWYLGILAGALLWVGIVPSGPKLAGIPLFDPGLVNVINTSTSDLASPYVPPGQT
jgi:NADH-quinone oxidoreductase subunit M